jgi:hypothetical protein
MKRPSRWSVLLAILPATSCRDAERAHSEAQRSETARACLAGNDEACDVVLAGVVSSEQDEWAGVMAALCRAGIAATCLTHDSQALGEWRRGCAEGSYRSCKAVIVLEGIIERRDSSEVTEHRRRALTGEWCDARAAAPRSLYACFDRVADIGESVTARSEALTLLADACQQGSLEACARVIASHLSLVKQNSADVFEVSERHAARTLIEAQSQAAHEGALARLAQLCEAEDWAACGYCGDLREGHVGTPSGQTARVLPASRRQQCDRQWLTGAREFRATVLATNPP